MLTRSPSSHRAPQSLKMFESASPTKPLECKRIRVKVSHETARKETMNARKVIIIYLRAPIRSTKVEDERKELRVNEVAVKEGKGGEEKTFQSADPSQIRPDADGGTDSDDRSTRTDSTRPFILISDCSCSSCFEWWLVIAIGSENNAWTSCNVENRYSSRIIILRYCTALYPYGGGNVR